jgi:RHH-type proline utilization regulon transcriptional repressor/proline dehydrogenase/delta 1-pyrroline-5-carboxylate dehydrogenase
MTLANPPDTSGRIEQRIQQLGSELWERIRGEVPGIFNKGYWQGKLMESVMADPSFKVDLFRFVDVLPTLQTTEQVQSHLKEYLMKPGRDVGLFMGTAMKLATVGLTAGLAVKTIRKNVTEMAQRFIVGRDAAEALPVLRKLYSDGFAFTVDLLGEATTSNAEADAYQARYLDLINNLQNEVSRWPADPLIDRNHLGPIPRTNVSVKVSAMEPQVDPVDPAGSVERMYARVLPLFLAARERGIFLNVDLEQWSLNRITYDLFERLVTHPQLRDYPHFGIVVQAYLRSGESDARRLLEIARRRGAPLTVRLVKGAYWDYEVVLARQNGYPCPVYTDKAATDASYERITRFLLDHAEHLQPAFASHNLRSLTHALVMAEERKLPAGAIEIQMLYGMAEPERAALRAMGQRVRLYAPVGELLPGMAYLVRRLLENTANSGFLKISHHDGADIRKLLQPPRPGIEPDSNPRPMRSGDLGSPFDNAPLTDFTDRTEHERFQKAVKDTRGSLPRAVPVVIGGRERPGSTTWERRSPNDPSIVVAKVAMGTAQDAADAARIADEAFPSWRDKPLAERAMLLEKLADRLERDRIELAAQQVWEVAKPWKEADADVAEAIDFCRYYARMALQELGPRKQGNVPGEDNRMHYEGRGVCAVIAPWNFPLAILCGMTTAALVAGNTVVMKPAEQSSWIAHELYTRMLAVGFDPKVVQFLPGDGAVVGAALVRDPRVVQIAFTGSKVVGLQIVRTAADTQPEQRQVRRVVCEMGGKNAIVIDDDADLDEAVLGVLRSAFGYAGQKCSACSRVVVVGTAYRPFISRLIDACRSISITGAPDPACTLPPVVDEEAQARLLEVINNPGAGAKPLYIGQAPGSGWFVPPAVFEVSDRSHRLLRDEFFGPIVAVTSAETFEHAIELANDSAYRLTGAVFSRSPGRLEYARARFRVGNLYLNRGSTGAMVDRQPFGGFGMSGIGTKAGGPNYLVQFADPRVVTENTMRRGVTPELA